MLDFRGLMLLCRFLFLVTVAMELSACTSVNDLSLISVDVVDVQSVNPLIKNDIRQYSRSKDNVMRVSFSTATDLIDIGKRVDNLFYRASVCTANNLIADGKTIASSFYMMHGEQVFGSTQTLRLLKESPARNAPSPREPYVAYFDIDRPPYAGRLLVGQPPPYTYNLKERPEDVCFQIAGGDMWTGVGFTSNILVIPKEAIASALAQTK